MFSYNSNLSDFVGSIPLGQSESDLGSILNIFKQTNCDLVAIPLKNNTWGTISAQSLLSLMPHVWQREGIALASHSKSGATQTEFSHLIAEDISCLVKPAIACSGNTKIQEFLSSLNSLNNNFLADHEQTEYLLIDSFGNLEGRLDRDKVLCFLASTINQVDQSQTQPRQESDAISSVQKLLDSIALPLRLETVQGKYSYSNPLWQSLVGATSNLSGAKQQQVKPLPDTAIVNWWLEQQSHINQQGFTPANEPANHANQLYLSCCSKASFAGTSFDNGAMPLQVSLGLDKRLGLEFFNHNAVMDADKKQQFSPAIDSQFGIQIEQKQDWNHIKIPLTSLAQESNLENIQAANRPLYWLILATQLNEIQSNNQVENSAAPTSNLLVNKLLKTVSHELKSPLTGIMGLSSLLKGQQLGKLNQRQLQYIQLIHQGGQKLMGTVHDLLELTKLSTSHYKFQLESVNLKSLCHGLYRQVLTRLQVDHEAKPNLVAQNIRLKLDIEPELEIVVADKPCLSTILFHLILEIFEYLESAQVESCRNVLQIKVENCQAGISVKVSTGSNQSHPGAAESSGLPNQSSGLNLVLAKYLAQTTKAEVDSAYFVGGCQFTLSMAKTNSASELRILQRQEAKALDRLEMTDSQACILGRSSSQVSPGDTSLPSNERQNLTNLTILCLYPESQVIDSLDDQRSDLDFNLKNWAEQDWFKVGQEKPDYQYRIIEADGLEQAHTLARIWQLDIILLDGYQIVNPIQYLRSLQGSEYLAVLPIVTLDTRTTEAANQIEGLNVYPCLLPTERRSVKDLMQVIQIATET